MEKFADEGCFEEFNGFFGSGYIHAKTISGPGNSTRWQWQVYIAGKPQAPEREAAKYQGSFANCDLAKCGATRWMNEYFILGT